MQLFPELIPNWIDGAQQQAASGESFANINPHDGQELCQVTRSQAEDVQHAVAAAQRAQPAWADTPPVQRGMLLHKIVRLMQDHQDELARIVAAESGKAHKHALGEVGGATACGLFYASEGQRLYARTTTSGTPHKYNSTVRQPVGVAGLIIAANTPIANVAWKVFPALVCGNGVVLKAAEDTPGTAWFFGKLAQEAGLPDGILNIIQGYGPEAGAPLVEHPDVGVLSFTGSSGVGRQIAVKAGERLAKVSLELGGKNPLIVCDDADLENAATWVILSAFSNAGQRCASGSRIIVFDAVYDTFKQMLIERTQQLKLGVGEDDDFGPVINERQLTNMLAAIDKARQAGATILTGGDRMRDPAHQHGSYLAPTLIENVDPHAEISTHELFGPITCLYRVPDYEAALALANDSPYGLTACIHTRSLHRAIHFTRKVQTGVVVVNAGTYGSEPHMPFGGTRQSGNGSREPGTEAIDIYSDLKDVYMNIDPQQV
jgi:aldehyde dehydrogenase (NAD+)